MPGKIKQQGTKPKTNVLFMTPRFAWPLLFAFASFLLSCQKEEPYQSPLIQTGEVTDIGPEGAIFHGKILGLGNRKILDYGFVWDYRPEPSIENQSYIKSLGIADEITVFDTKINSALVKGQSYYVRAFIKDEKSLVYGRVVVFNSMGSMSPSIISFTPKTGSWEDTLKISGTNFSNMANENIVSFGDKIAKTTFGCDTLIKVIVPLSLSFASSKISLAFQGKSTISADSFKLNPPEIIEFTPEDGTYKTTVVIKGKNFHPYLTKVTFDSIQARIISANSSIINVEVPSGLPYGDVELIVETPGGKIVSYKKFRSQIPQILDFNPKTATFGEEVVIDGINFSDNTSTGNIVKFGNIQATVTEASFSKLKVIVPNGLKFKNSKISVTVTAQTGTTENDFILKSPQIEGFTPETGTFRDLITITGNYFNPISTNNFVKLGDVNANIVSASSNQIQIRVPDNYSSANGKSKIIVSIGEPADTSINEFDLTIHSISQISPDNGIIADRITISGQSFNPVQSNNAVYVGNLKATLYSSSTTSIIFNIPDATLHGEHEVKVVTGGREVKAPINLMVYQPWKKLSSFGNLTRGFGFAINGKGYAGGSSSSTAFWEYNPETDQWLRKADIPVSGMLGPASTSTSARGYVVFNKIFLQYNPIKDEWIRLEDYPGTATQSQVAFSIGSKIYVGTGKIGSVATNEFWEYDEESNTWTRKADYLGGNVSGCFSFTLSNKAYIGLGEQNKSIYEYDPALDNWTLKILDAPIPYNRMHHGIGFSVGSKGYFAFGFAAAGITGAVFEFDPIDNSIKQISILRNGYRAYPVGFSIGSKAFIGYGYAYSTIVSDFWEFDPSKAKP
jgi:hypothetical protein